MASVKGCNIPDDLYYNVENNVWARREGDGTVTIGMTTYAAALAGQIVSCTPKKVGRSVEQNKSAVTVESGKWVGPVKVAGIGRGGRDQRRGDVQPRHHQFRSLWLRLDGETEALELGRGLGSDWSRAARWPRHSKRK